MHRGGEPETRGAAVGGPGGEEEIKADRTAPLIVLVGQHRVVGGRRKKHQQASLGSHILPRGVEGVIGRNRPAVADGQARHQFVHLPVREEPEGAATATAITRDVVHGTEVGVGVVVTPDRLPRLAHHGPGPLQMQLQLIGVEAQHPQIGHSNKLQLADQPAKGRAAVYLPRVMKVTCPGAAFRRIARISTTKLQSILQHHG